MARSISSPLDSAVNHAAEDATGANAAQSLPAVQVPRRPAEQRARVRLCLPPSRAKHLPLEPPPDSTRIVHLPTGRFGVRYGRLQTGERTSPPWHVVGSLSDAQAKVSQYRIGVAVVAFLRALCALASGGAE